MQMQPLNAEQHRLSQALEAAMHTKVRGIHLIDLASLQQALLCPVSAHIATQPFCPALPWGRSSVLHKHFAMLDLNLTTTPLQLHEQEEGKGTAAGNSSKPSEAAPGFYHQAQQLTAIKNVCGQLQVILR